MIAYTLDAKAWGAFRSARGWIEPFADHVAIVPCSGSGEFDQLDQLGKLADNSGVGASAMAANSAASRKKSATPVQINLYEAKTHLSSLVERAAQGEEIVIAKAGKPMARLVAPAPQSAQPRKPGGNFMMVTYIADDFDAPLPEEILKDFGI